MHRRRERQARAQHAVVGGPAERQPSDREDALRQLQQLADRARMVADLADRASPQPDAVGGGNEGRQVVESFSIAFKEIEVVYTPKSAANLKSGACTYIDVYE